MASIIDYEIRLLKENKDMSSNIDLQEIPDLFSKKLHYSQYKIVEKKLLVELT